jgi:hypothetical protein
MKALGLNFNIQTIIRQGREVSKLYERLSYLDTNLYKLDKLKSDLQYNINFLKSSNINIILTEYYKSINELRQVTKIINEINKIQNNIELELSGKLKDHITNLSNFISYKKQALSGNNVIKFRRNNVATQE